MLKTFVRDHEAISLEHVKKPMKRGGVTKPGGGGGKIQKE